MLFKTEENKKINIFEQPFSYDAETDLIIDNNGVPFLSCEYISDALLKKRMSSDLLMPMIEEFVDFLNSKESR